MQIDCTFLYWKSFNLQEYDIGSPMENRNEAHFPLEKNHFPFKENYFPLRKRKRNSF